MLGIALGTLAHRAAIGGDVAASVGQHDEEGRASARARRLGEHSRRVEPGGQRRAATARQIGERAPCTRQRASRRQQDLRADPAKRHQRDLRALYIGLREQQLDRALRLGQSRRRRRARRIDREDRHRFRTRLEATDAQVVAANPDRADATLAQLLPRRGGAQRVDQAQPQAATRNPGTRAERATAQRRLAPFACAARPIDPAPCRAGREPFEHVARERGERGGEHDVVGRFGRTALFLARLAFGRRGWRVGRAVVLRRRGNLRRARAEDEPDREDHIGFVGFATPRQRRRRARGAQREQRSARRIDAECGSSAAENRARVDRWRVAACNIRFGVGWQRVSRPAALGQVDPKRQPLDQGLRRRFVLDPVIERDHRNAHRHRIDRARVEHRGDPRRSRLGNALRHRQHDDPAIRGRKHSALPHRPPERERRAEIEPTEQRIVIDMRGNPPQRRAFGKVGMQACDDAVAHFSAAAQDHAPQADWIDRAQPRR